MLNMKGGRLAIRGFTLIELVVGITLLSILLLIALPEMQTYSRNSKIRRTAESFAADMMAARAEAIRSNSPVVFTLTSSAPAADPLTVSQTGPNWSASVVPATGARRLVVSQRGAGSSGEVVDIRAANEASAQITFNGLGAPNLSAPAAFRFNYESLNEDCDLSKAIRCLQVEVAVGGRVRICEPGRAAAATAASDTRTCEIEG